MDAERALPALALVLVILAAGFGAHALPRPASSAGQPGSVTTPTANGSEPLLWTTTTNQFRQPSRTSERGAGGDGFTTVPDDRGDPGGSTPLALLALGVALLGGLLVVYWATGDATAASLSEDESEPAAETDVSAVGRAAGRAADRIEDAARYENEVYRAWHEMTRHLAVPNPGSSTPGEFADAATEAGMDPDDVRALTRLFEEVRYGDAEVGADREDRAVEILRRIEDAYAGGDA